MRNIFRKIFKKKLELVDMLPPLEGRVSANEPLKKRNWFGVGGPAQAYVEPANESDLALLLRFMPNVPLTVLGAGSNVLIRDGGIPGVVVHLGHEFVFMKMNAEKNQITCGAATMMMDLARFAEQNSLSGFEFMCGIPGSIGGGIRMNAGAYGKSLKDILVSLRFMTDQGDVKEIIPGEMEIFGYRKCFLPTDWIFLSATFQGKKVEKSIIAQKMAEYQLARKKAQPIGVKTAGSTFKNPEGLQAWKLIDNAGIRSLRVGDAVISDKHANFLVNQNQASAKDIESLGELIRQKVWESSGVELEWEVKRIGVENETK